jgi:hypothetical protein
VRRGALPLNGGPLASSVEEALRQCRARIGPVSNVVIGVPARHVYYETRRPAPAAGAKLHGVETVAALGGREVAPPIVQSVRRPDRRSGGSLQTVIACRDSVLAALESAAPNDGAVSWALEPSALAALRLSLLECPPADPAGPSVRVLLGPAYCAAYLLDGTRAQMIAVAPEHDPADRDRHVRALVASLVHHARAYLEIDVQQVEVQGADPMKAGALGQGLEPTVRLLAGPPLDAFSFAAGLALGSCGVTPSAVHLHRHARERRRASRSNFPWRDAVAGGVAVSMIGFSMEVEARRLRSAIARTQAEHPEEPALRGRATSELEAQRARQATFRDQWMEFDDRPVSWSRTLASLVQALPDQVRLTRIAGENPKMTRLPSPGAKSYSLSLVSPEKHTTLGAMLADAYLKRAFPRVEVSMSVPAEGRSGLQYTIVAVGTGPVPDSAEELEAARPPGPP